MIREVVYLLIAAASIVMSTLPESRVSIPIGQNSLVGYERKINNNEHTLNAAKYMNTDQWQCGSGYWVELAVFISYGCWDKYAEVNMCCAVHDDCYGLQRGQEFCDSQFCSCLNDTLKWTGYGTVCFDGKWTDTACKTVSALGEGYYKPYPEGYVDPKVVYYAPALNKTVEENYMKLYETCTFMNVTFSNCAYNHILCYMRLLPDRNAQIYENCVDNLITCLDESSSALAPLNEPCLTQVEITMMAIAENNIVSGIPTIREAKQPKNGYTRIKNSDKSLKRNRGFL